MAGSSTLGAGFANRTIRYSVVTTLHQAIAFDALERLTVADTADWQRTFMLHARTFALGAIAPDVDFRDFKNHLLFPNDGMWGGAALKARCWYQNLRSALARNEWENASYCAGVLSHYVTDALHPLNTAQSQADNNAYAALEYCMIVTYGDLKRSSCLGTDVSVALPGEDVAAAVSAGACKAHRQYSKLLEHFDWKRTASDPATSLAPEGKVIMADFVDQAAQLTAGLLAAAIAESTASPPPVSATFAALRAMSAAPIAALAHWHHRRALRIMVRRTLSEFCATGAVVESAPISVRVKRELYAREVLLRRQPTVRNVVSLRSVKREPAVVEPTATKAKVLRFGAPSEVRTS